MPGRIFFSRRTPTTGSSSSTPSSSASSISSAEIPVISGLKRASKSKTAKAKRSSQQFIDQPLATMDLLSHSKAKHAAASEPAVKIDMEIESPPLVLFGPPAASTGALLSGQLKLVISVPEITINSLSMDLLAQVTTKKPVAPHCADCAKKTDSLETWTFLSAPHVLKAGVHSYPFSHLLPGNLPTTCYGKLGNIEYSLSAKALTSPTSARPITFTRPIKVQRSIPSIPEKTSVRIFPPTNLTASVTFPPMIHPFGEFPVFLRLDGVVVRNKGMQTRWRLRKMNWRLEENSKIVSPACPKHASKVGGEGKGVLHQDSRTIGDAELKKGWKTDFSGNGQIEMEFKCALKADRDPICDVESPTGLVATHNFVVELIVAEEYCYDRTPNAVTPTGSARVLRMQFALVITERPGMGISWDEEQPPMYTDVPASPPTYMNVEHYGGPPLDDPETFALN